MVLFKNVHYGNFLLETKGKRIICYGAGGTLRDFLESNRANHEVLDKIDFVVDKNHAKTGSIVQIGARELPVAPADHLPALAVPVSGYAVILCLAAVHIPGALRFLDNVPALDNIPCYHGISALQWGQEIFPPLISALPAPEKRFAIPKTIHYCWFGNNAMGPAEQACVESWRRCCPHYTVKLWNEAGYDLSQTPQYVRQAYAAGKYAFVSDYVRLDVVYRYGGVYLDTDVELLRSLDTLLCYKAFFAFESLNLISTGLGFGSVANHPVLLQLRNLYQNIPFWQADGTMNMTSCPAYHTAFFEGLGVRADNRMQLVDDTLFLPSDYLCPLNVRSVLLELTCNTLANHQFNVSWFESGVREEWNSTLCAASALNTRLKADWKRETLRHG